MEEAENEIVEISSFVSFGFYRQEQIEEHLKELKDTCK